VAATDPFGACPIYYATSRGRVAVATTTPELWNLPWVGNELDTETVVAFLVNVSPAPNATYYRRIKRLPGGHTLIARRGRLEIRRTWGPQFPADPDVSTPAAYLEKFRELFFDAVSATHGRGDPAAILMSGGFDSTSVACVAAVLARQEPKAFPSTRVYSTVFPGLFCDETPRIRKVQACLPFECRQLCPEERSLTVPEITSDVRFHDGPQVALQRIVFDSYFQACRDDRVSVLLGGLAGDELTIDWAYHIDLLRRSGWLGLPHAVSAIARLEAIPLGSAVVLALRASLPSWLSQAYTRIRRGTSDVLRDALVPELWPLATRLARPETLPVVGYDCHSSEIRWRTINDPHCQRAHAWWDREFEGAGLRLAAPLRDRRLFELVLGTPSHLHPRTFDRGEYKPLITRGLGTLLPPRSRLATGRSASTHTNGAFFHGVILCFRTISLGPGSGRAPPSSPRAPHESSGRCVEVA
jgi:asparagine synthase (glutamine-hydrolysing)